jgi:hypothetical protein
LARAHAPHVIAAAVLLASTLARADPNQPRETPQAPPEPPEITRSSTWPFVLDLHLLLGAEPKEQATPVAFGVGAEALWRALVGPFGALLASAGTILVPKAKGTQAPPSLADRISVPLGLAVRPLARYGWTHDTWLGRLGAGVGAQLGVTIEHLRTSDDDATTAGLHLALSVDVPLYGGPVQGGVALRLYGRFLYTPSVTLEANKSVVEPAASGQIYAGLCWYP